MCPTAPPDCPPPDRRPPLQLLALEMVARGRQHGVCPLPPPLFLPLPCSCWPWRWSRGAGSTASSTRRSLASWASPRGTSSTYARWEPEGGLGRAKCSGGSVTVDTAVEGGGQRFRYSASNGSTSINNGRMLAVTFPYLYVPAPLPPPQFPEEHVPMCALSLPLPSVPGGARLGGQDGHHGPR